MGDTTTIKSVGNTTDDVTKSNSQQNPVMDAMKSSSIDKGHRMGNFHNYYTFHPPTSRLDTLEETGFFTHVIENWNARNENHNNIGTPAKRQKRNNETEKESIKKIVLPLKYCDLGCNEGDMTIGVAQRIRSAYSNAESTKKEGDKDELCSISIHSLGLDIDGTLIERANQKHKDDDANNDACTSEFYKCNICDETEHKSKCLSFFSSLNGKSTDNYIDRFDVTTVFSTTMWVHVNTGDDGLRKFLQRCCKITEMILVEPQSSSCYGKVNKRLRKMNRPEIKNISDLVLRPNIEQEIEAIIIKCGFEKIDLKDHVMKGKKKSWDRKILLYKRKSE